MSDLFMYAILGAVLLFFFFLYLMARRTVLGFKEGMDGSRNGKS